MREILNFIFILSIIFPAESDSIRRKTIFDTAYIHIKGKEFITYPIYLEMFNPLSEDRVQKKSNNSENAIPEISPYPASSILLRLRGDARIPPTNPISPHMIIWNGVHIPCPKNMFETSADKAPVINPASFPKYIAVKTVIAVTGLNPGVGAKIILLMTDTATMTAMVTVFIAGASLFSKDRKKGIQESTAAQSAIHIYMFSPKNIVPATVIAGTRRSKNI